MIVFENEKIKKCFCEEIERQEQQTAFIPT